MSRTPPNTPEKGDRCRKRGVLADAPIGTVISVAPDGTKWCRVIWADRDEPQMCHLHELEKIKCNT